MQQQTVKQKRAYAINKVLQSQSQLVATASFNAKRSIHTADDEIDANRCCVYFGMHADNAGTGREWVECQCSRWIHEDCIDDDYVDTEQCIFGHFVKTGPAEMVQLFRF